ncbi:MAG: ABC transporter ATP-binding protein [Sphaerochaeta sp.]|jgi:ABC-type Fe3+/spermidine/putrescine transport system ATPase subunit|nr:ABC transporter ATP-binding protein [Sphaerochaeta sp.]HAP57452.1 ABC transporter ATP-binding protein [Sphaerochaeta sp.]
MTDDGLSCSLKASYQDFNLDVSFSVKSGELACIIGPSGCGKSTTLQLIAGLLPLNAGKLVLNGRDISHTSVHERQIAMVFQDYALFPHMSVEQNIAYPLKIRKVGREKRKERIARLLSMVALEGYQKRKSQQLSGGERQRVALARALASDPKLLLLDEPLSALDAKLRKHLREEIRRIHDETGITTLYVTHDQEEALSLADRIIVMHEGRVMQEGTGEQIYNEPTNLFVATFMGEGNALPYSIIPKTLVNPGGTDPFVFKPKEGKHTIFFRPEEVLVQDNKNLPLAEYLVHLQFKQAEVLSCEFQGDHYRLVCSWEGYPIISHCSHRPKSRNVTLGVRVKHIREYVDGQSVTKPLLPPVGE